MGSHCKHVHLLVAPFLYHTEDTGLHGHSQNLARTAHIQCDPCWARSLVHTECTEHHQLRRKLLHSLHNWHSHWPQRWVLIQLGTRNIWSHQCCDNLLHACTGCKWFAQHPLRGQADKDHTSCRLHCTHWLVRLHTFRNLQQQQER